MDTFFWCFWGFLMGYSIVGWSIDIWKTTQLHKHHHEWGMWELNWEGAFNYSSFQHRECKTCGLREERYVS